MRSPSLDWPVRISGVGRYLPRRVVSNTELEGRLGLSPGWIERRNGVRRRHWARVEDGESASEMGAAAAVEALAMADLDGSQVDLLINASGTPQQAIPDGGPWLQRRLLRRGVAVDGVPAVSVHSTCLSFLSGLQTAAAWIASGVYRRILLVSSDIASVGLNPSSPETYTLLGDAAAAAVVERAGDEDASRLEAMAFATYSEGAELTEIRGCGTSLPPHGATTGPDDHLFHMDGRRSLRLAAVHSASFLETLRSGLSKGLGDIDWVVPHQTSRAGLAMLYRFSMPEEKIVRTLDRLGNCIAASLPATLYEAVISGRLERGQRVLLAGTGAGLCFGGVVLVF